MKVSLALSGGGIRAVAHLGVVEVLTRAGFQIESVAGASGGSLVGALLCDGKDPKEIVARIRELRLWDLFGAAGRGGIFTLEKVGEILRAHLSTGYIEDLAIDFSVACTDLAGGEVHHFDKGPVVDLCVASSSLVPIFSPVRYGDLLLADGGFMENMPTSPLREKGRPIIGINVNPIVSVSAESVVQTTARALELMMAANIEASKREADFFIEPIGCAGINIFDLRKVDEAYEAGRQEAQKVVPKLIETLCAI